MTEKEGLRKHEFALVAFLVAAAMTCAGALPTTLFVDFANTLALVYVGGNAAEHWAKAWAERSPQ